MKYKRFEHTTPNGHVIVTVFSDRVVVEQIIDGESENLFQLPLTDAAAQIIARECDPDATYPGKLHRDYGLKHMEPEGSC